MGKKDVSITFILQNQFFNLRFFCQVQAKELLCPNEHFNTLNFKHTHRSSIRESRVSSCSGRIGILTTVPGMPGGCKKKGLFSRKTRKVRLQDD